MEIKEPKAEQREALNKIPDGSIAFCYWEENKWNPMPLPIYQLDSKELEEIKEKIEKQRAEIEEIIGKLYKAIGFLRIRAE